MHHELVAGIVFGLWAYCLTRMVGDGEILAAYGRFVNRHVYGTDYPQGFDVTGWRYVWAKYTYCTFCLAGMLATVGGLIMLLTGHTLTPLFIMPPVAMVTTTWRISARSMSTVLSIPKRSRCN